MVFEIIINGIGDVLGWELVGGILLLFSFALFAVSRGLGFTALFSVITLGVYLMATNIIDTRYLLGQDVLILMTIITGLFIGWLVYIIFIRD